MHFLLAGTGRFAPALMVLWSIGAVGCVTVERAPPREPPQIGATPGGAAAPEPPAVDRAKPPASPTPAPRPKAAPPPLDLKSLEQRLRDTSAIGTFTKLALKNQVDDLLEQFRAHYEGRQKTTLAALRQPYDRLLLKVLSLLQDSDPALARDIVASREAIWAILADRNRFNSLI